MKESNSSDSDITNFRDLQYTLQRELDEHWYVRANQQNFMDKGLNQTIMVRSKLRNKYLKPKSEIDNRDITSRKTTVLNYCVLKSRNITNPLTSVT